jgi:hypothetical protein
MLKELIEILSKERHDKVLKLGFAEPHSYRGYYADLAFEPVENVTVESMLENAKQSVGKVFDGWKGGEFLMGEYTDCWLAEHGGTGETLGPILLSYMLKDEVNCLMRGA